MALNIELAIIVLKIYRFSVISCIFAIPCLAFPTKKGLNKNIIKSIIIAAMIGGAPHHRLHIILLMILS